MPGTQEAVFHFADIEVREREFRLIKAGEVVPVEPKAFRVLLFLLYNPQKLIAKEELLNAVWGETAVSENSLTRSIALLRRLLEDDPHLPQFIETVSTVGYRFVCPVKTEESSESSGRQSPQVAEIVPISGAARSEELVSTPAFKEKAETSLLRRRWPWVLAVGLAAAIGIAVVWMAWFSAPPTLVVTSIEAITHDGLTKLDLKNDGSRIYFTEVVHQRYLLSQVSASGGEISRIGSPLANTRVRDVSPDGSKLLVSELSMNGVPQAFWIVPLPSGTPRRLGALEGHAAAWSPDGKRLIFARSSELWTADSEGANPRMLPATSGFRLWLQFSPDGERIRYSLFSRVAELWESRADGSAAHTLLPGWHATLPHFDGAWNPDGRYYAFLESTGIVNNIWVLPETRSLWSHRNHTPAQLTHGPLSFDFLSFGPGGRTLFAVGVLKHGELVRYDPGTGQVSPYLSGISAGDLAFSRDGQWIAYNTYPDETLWRCRIDGSDRQQLTTRGSATLPVWSPDGKSIAYMKSELGKPTKIAIISMNGGNAEAADQEEWNESDANWSPDGTRMIFHATTSDLGSGQIRELDLRTHRLTSIPGSKGLYSPRWSPDGRYLAAVSVDWQRLMQFDFQKQIWTTWITAQDVNTQRSIAYPVWSRDSRFLYFGNILSSGLADVYEWRTRPGQHVAEKILDLQDESRYSGRSSIWSTVGPDGAVYFTRDRSSSEIYALHLGEK